MDRTQHSRPFSYCHCRRVLPKWSLVSIKTTFLAGLLCFGLVAGADLEDFAQIYVDEYFEPPLNAGLSEIAENKAEALAYFAVGRMQENSGHMEKAITSYLKVLELQPDQLNLARKSAQMLASQAGKQSKGKALLEATLERNRSQPFPYVMLSEFLATYHSNNQDNKDRALALAKEAVEKFPDEPMTYEHLAKMYLLGKRKGEARALLQNSLTIENTDPDFWIRLGKVAVRVWPIRLGVDDNEKELAILNQFYARATKHAGRDDSIKERAGDFYSATRQFDKAETIYKGLVARKTDRLDLRKKLARVYRANGNTEGYIKTLLGIVEIHPGDATVHRQLASAFRGKGDTQNSVKHQRIALKIGKGTSKDYLAVAHEMIDEKLNKEAVEFIKEAAYLFPEEPEFHRLLSYSYGSLDQHKEAIKAYEECEKVAKKHRPSYLTDRFYFGFGSTVEQGGDIDRAAKLFNKTIELVDKHKQNPKETETSKKFRALVYNYLGYMWIENDKNIEAAGILIKDAILLDPDSGAIADSLGWFYFKKGQYEDAKKELLRSERLLEESKQDPDAVIMDHIGRTFYALGNKDKAIEYMARAVELDPEEKDFAERLSHFKNSEAPAENAEAAANP